MMSILVFYGSYRSDRMGIRLADYIVKNLAKAGCDAELIDAKAIGLPMLDRMYKEYAPGTAPAPMQTLAAKIKAADGFVFVVGEYNWGVQPGLKNLTDHFLEEWFWRPAAIASYSAGRFAGARANLAWHGTLSEMGMVVISSTLGGLLLRRLMTPGCQRARRERPSTRLVPALPQILPGGRTPQKPNAQSRRHPIRMKQKLLLLT
jgi:NAD(P)H-dependent FMN reductase